MIIIGPLVAPVCKNYIPIVDNSMHIVSPEVVFRTIERPIWSEANQVQYLLVCWCIFGVRKL